MSINAQQQVVGKLPVEVQKLLNWFVFFLAVPGLYILGNSVTFYIFLLIIFRIGFFWRNKSRGVSYFFAFLLLVFVSVISAPYSRMPRHPGFTSSILICIQYTYWIMLASFFIIYRRSVNFLLLSKWLFFGCIASIISFYFLDLNIDLIVAKITTKDSRNGFVFTLLSTAPLVFYYVVHRYGMIKATLILMLLTVAMFFTNGRSGAIIIVLEGLLILSICRTNVRRFLVAAVVTLGLIASFFGTRDFSKKLENTAVYFDYINPRLADLLRGEGEGDLTLDKSWLIRELMIDKGKELIQQYPLFGVGPNGFRYVDSELKTLTYYERLSSHDVDFYNSRSAHNSYLQILTELGFMGFICFVLLLFIPVAHFFVRFQAGKITLKDLPLISLIGISIHFYAISSITGAISWFVLGLAWSAYLRSKDGF